MTDSRCERGNAAAQHLPVPGTRVLTDGLGAFRGLNGLGFDHQVVSGGNLFGEGDRDPFPYVQTKGTQSQPSG